jgi:hypothetical protein
VRGGQHEDLGVVIVLHRLERVQELAEELVGERVPRLRVVQGDGRDAVCDGKLDLLVSSHE